MHATLARRASLRVVLGIVEPAARLEDTILQQLAFTMGSWRKSIPQLLPLEPVVFR
jgi:hypothetical protein